MLQQHTTKPDPGEYSFFCLGFDRAIAYAILTLAVSRGQFFGLLFLALVHGILYVGDGESLYFSNVFGSRGRFGLEANVVGQFNVR
ncbi:hypothetical protein BS50DRAFT_184907 [Corynespora cassiicola Philippines]|uniref:Uncharacterized protein n=1 Tax=Corynespora cassiicola Philippines TaxID=1448308 RepID=A0A2T2P6S4_CORCC|nr:hypothetical protein BS50DRAFT_184907 [Corynespora cassiicola Philippines]